jgi:hypothetical protein
MAFTGHDQVIQDSKSKNLRSLGQLFVYAKIGLAWLKVAGGVIVGEDDGGGSISDNVGKHFARMNRTFIEQADGDYALFDDLVCAVQGDADKILLLFSSNIG